MAMAILVLSAPGTSPAGIWRHFLPSESVNAVAFDPQNQIYWFGMTSKGVASYDGRSFRFFDIERSNGVLPSNSINALAVDNDVLWIGTGQGLVKYQSLKQEWTAFDTGDGLVAKDITALYVDLIGCLWFGTRDKGVGKFDGLNWYRFDENGLYEWLPQSSEWSLLKNNSGGQSPNEVNVIEGDLDGRIYVGTKTEGLFILEEDTSWTHLSHPEDFSFSLNNDVQAIVVEDSGLKWLGTRAGVVRMSEQDLVDTTYTRLSVDDLLSNDIRAIWIDRAGAKFIGSVRGINTLDRSETIWGQLTEAESSGPVSSTVRSIAGDSDDNVWFAFGGGNGVSQFNYKWQTIMQEGDDDLTSNFVYAIDTDRHGRIWISTRDGVLAVFGTEWTHFSYGCAITTIVSTSTERVWAGTTACGLFALSSSGRDDYFDTTYPRNFPSDQILSIALEQDSLLWVGTDLGLCRLSFDESAKPICEPHFLDTIGLSNEVQAILVDSAGNVWAGTPNGLARFDGQTWMAFNNTGDLPDLDIRTLAADSVGSIWVGTDRGAARFRDEQWRTFTTLDGLPSDNITAIATNPDGTVWCGTLGGAAIFDDSSMTWTPLTVEDGLSNNFITDITFESQNIVWFATWGGGLNRYHRTDVAPETQLLTNFSITSADNITFEFSGTDLNTPTAQLRYSHKLDTQKEWSRPSFGTFKTLEIKEEGRHTFRVRAVDKDGNFDNSEAILRFNKVSAKKGGVVDSVRVQKYGRLWLYIPPNSIEAGNFISVTPLDSDFVEIQDEVTLRFTGIAYDLSPDSLVIDKNNKDRPLTLKIFYGEKMSQGGFEEAKLGIYRLENRNWTRVGGTVNKDSNTITTTTYSLGIYGLFEKGNDSQFIEGSALEIISAQPRIFSPNGGGFLDKVTISFDLNKPAAVTAKVYNTAGRLVSLICENHLMNQGRNAIEWNGRDQNRNVCKSGLYVITVKTSQAMKTKTVAILNK